MSFIYARLFVLLQYLLPKFLLTSLVYRASRVRSTAVKNVLIRRFVKIYEVDTSELDRQIPDGFTTFNDFFTRELKDGARPIDPDETSLVSPADGTLSAFGKIEARQIIQAKGISYSIYDLLATNLADADEFVDGGFATIYLAPYNYHRVHAPLGGTLQSLRYVPGDLFSVNAATVNLVPGLFSRNERLICQFASERGPFAVIFVGALNVGSITTPWTGELRPEKRGVGMEIRLPDAASRDVQKGALLGWFNMGSTVITLMPPGAVEWHPDVEAGAICRVGRPIGRLGSVAPS